MTNLNPLALGWRAVDQLRRTQGLALDRLGLAPITTPTSAVMPLSGGRLLAYRQKPQAGPVALIVCAPIKRSYIWDLVPARSVVRRLLEAGIEPYLLQWDEPTRPSWGLDAYGFRFIMEALDLFAARGSPPRPYLIGHSLGGTLAAIFASLAPERLAGLVLLEAPLHFGADAGALARLVAAVPDTRPFIRALDGMAGSLLDTLSAGAAPRIFVFERWLDWIACATNAERAGLHLRVLRWTLDELPLPARLCEELIEALYREDRFLRGTLRVAGMNAHPRNLRRIRMIHVIDPRGEVAPPSSILPFHEALAPACDQTIVTYEGDAGVVLRHLGVLVGAKAHKELWPRLCAWMLKIPRAPHSERGERPQCRRSPRRPGRA